MKKLGFRTISLAVCLCTLIVTSGPTLAVGPDVALPIENVAKQVLDPMQGNNAHVTGYYTQQITFKYQDKEYTREAEFYVAEGAQLREYWTTIAIPDGEDSKTFLSKTGWFDSTDERGECMLILKPEAGTWGDLNYEVAYINAAIAAQKAEGWFFSCGVQYLVGYDEGAAPLEAWASQNPMSVISQVYINSTLDPDVLQKSGEIMSGTEISSIEPVSAKDIPVPSWFIGKTDSGNVDYWKNANDCFAAGQSDSVLGQVYFQDKVNSDALATCYSDVVSEVAVKEGSVNYDSKLTAQIADFLFAYTRYGSASVYSDVLGKRLIHEDAIADGRLSVDRFNWTDPSTGTVWARQYMVYVPENFAKLYPDGAPSLYIFPGMNQSDNLFFDVSHWWEVADKYGFVCVIPCAAGTMPSAWGEEPTAWNTEPASATKPDDIAFVKTVMDRVNAKYNLDATRRYITGQSLGCLFAQHVTMVYPEYFAAFGGTSAPVIMGPNTPLPEDPFDCIMPVSLIFGEHDNWPWKVGGLTDSDFKGNLVKYGRSGQSLVTQNYWTSRNGVGGVGDYVITNKDDLTGGGKSVQYIVNPEKADGDRYTTYTWSNTDNIPLFQWTVCAGRSHTCSVDNMWKLWEDWFTKWTLTEDGARSYEGKNISVFSDLSVSDWSYSAVAKAQEEGVIKGVTSSEFKPKGVMTLAEAVTMAARLHSDYLGDGYVFDQSAGDHWYDAYVDYAVNASIIKAGDFTNFSRPATRAEMAYIFARTYPESAYPSSVAVGTISDVAETDLYENEIIQLYKAGVLTGYDNSNAFMPENPITREETAAIISKMLAF